MAKKKNKRSRQSLFSKAINVALIILGFARPIQILTSVSDPIGFGVNQIVKEATFGLSEGAFDLSLGLRMYTPGGAALALGALKSHLMKKFPVRR